MRVCCIRFPWWSHCRYLVSPCLAPFFSLSYSHLSFPFVPPTLRLSGADMLLLYCNRAIFTFLFFFRPALLLSGGLVGLSPIGSGAHDDECRVTNSIDSGTVPPKVSRVLVCRTSIFSEISLTKPSFMERERLLDVRLHSLLLPSAFSGGSLLNGQVYPGEYMKFILNWGAFPFMSAPGCMLVQEQVPADFSLCCD